MACDLKITPSSELKLQPRPLYNRDLSSSVTIYNNQWTKLYSSLHRYHLLFYIVSLLRRKHLKVYKPFRLCTPPSPFANHLEHNRELAARITDEIATQLFFRLPLLVHGYTEVTSRLYQGYTKVTDVSDRLGRFLALLVQGHRAHQGLQIGPVGSRLLGFQGFLDELIFFLHLLLQGHRGHQGLQIGPVGSWLFGFQGFLDELIFFLHLLLQDLLLQGHRGHQGHQGLQIGSVGSWILEFQGFLDELIFFLRLLLQGHRGHRGLQIGPVGSWLLEFQGFLDELMFFLHLLLQGHRGHRGLRIGLVVALHSFYPSLFWFAPSKVAKVSREADRFSRLEEVLFSWFLRYLFFQVSSKILASSSLF
ncbi:uncharacterized protein LOC128896976 [Hylaeus anthracinus]|uniref:uncharacterized protein LOC128896976 n=1 Tax=Hylaeus anthracinus TaxID=313031 RepID=UPI0023B9C08F|nr:uncharacterized protein LOC128896976 [Hylaeus anthracinus]